MLVIGWLLIAISLSTKISYNACDCVWLQENELVQMQASPDTGSVDFINFDSPLELLQTLLQQMGGAATVNKLCKVLNTYSNRNHITII